MYQAVSRYNYLRHVYQRAMDVREEGATMTDEEAIIKIQAVRSILKLSKCFRELGAILPERK